MPHHTEESAAIFGDSLNDFQRVLLAMGIELA